MAYSGSQDTGSALDIKYLSTPTLKPFLESQDPLHSPLISDDEVSDHKASNALSNVNQDYPIGWSRRSAIRTYVASPQQSLSWPNEHASSVGHDSKSPPVWIALGRLVSVFSISTVSQLWYGLCTTAVGPGTSTDIEEIISVGANVSTVAAKRAYLDAKSSNQTDSKGPPSIDASTRTDPEKARTVRTVLGINIEEATSLRVIMAFSEP